MDKVLAVLALFVAVACAEVSITVTLSKEEANIGDDLTVTCRVVQDQVTEYFIYWVKKIGEQETQIGTNSRMNPYFEKSGRYTSNYQFDELGVVNKVTFSLFIRSVTAADSGQFGCKIPKKEIEVFNFKQFTVKVPIASVRLSSQYTNLTHAVSYSDGQNVTFDEGETRRFFCHVNGSYPEPRISMLLGNKNITHLFNSTSTLVQAGKIPGLKSLYYSASLRNESLVIGYEFSGKVLTCLAEIPGYDMPDANSSINLQLSGYKPKFLCNQSMMAGSHMKNVVIQCAFTADPPHQSVLFFWKRQSGANMTILPGGHEGHYTADLVPGNEPNHHIMKLHIDRVYYQLFRKYFFQAQNELGTTVHEIELIQDAKLDVQPFVPYSPAPQEPEYGHVGSAATVSLGLLPLLFCMLFHEV